MGKFKLKPKPIDVKVYCKLVTVTCVLACDL